MLKRVLMALLTVVAVAGFAQVASAQYMYLDANANGVHDTGDRLNANGTATTVDVFVKTNTNRDGSTAICDTDSAVPLTINQYQVNLLAVGGTVTYTNFVNQQSATMTVAFGEFNPDGVRYKNGFGGGTQLAAGTYRLMTITITGATGSPRIDMVDLVNGSQDFTGFGTACLGRGFDNVYRLDGPNVPPATGDVGDFLDWDGLAPAGVANTAPVLGAIGNRTVNELATLAFTATATDADVPAQTLTFSLDAGVPAGATINGSTGAFSWTPTEAQGPSSNPITVRVTDNGAGNLSDFELITVTVNEVNAAPVVTSPGNRVTNELANLAFTVTATDADIPANTIAWSLTLGTPAATGATIGAGTGAFSWTPTEAQGPGTYPVTIVATDNGTPALSGNAPITITVNEVNSAPVVTSPGNRTTAELANLAFTVTATDADVPANTIAWSLTLGTPAATGATIGAGNGAFSWTPTEAQGPGTYPVTITATDNGTPALSGTAAITISVTEVNVAPMLAAIGNKSGTISTPITFTATATDADIPANTLTFSLDAGAPAGATIGAATGAFAWTPSANGTFPVTVRVTDNGTPAMNDFEAISITVSPAPNTPPVLGAIGNKTVNELATLAFTATATDADVPAQTLTFSLDAGAPAGATINGSTGAFSWTPTEAQGPASTPITVRVTDNGTGNLSDSELITVTVNEVNVAPVVTSPGNRTTAELANLAFTVTATDADVPANTIAWSLTLGTPAATGATIGAGTGAFSWTPTEAQGPGTYPVTIVATDNGTPALSGNAPITITVTEVNVAPVVTSPGNRTTAELANLAFTVTATDADVPANTIAWSLTLGTPAATGATIGAGTGAFSWTPTEAQGPGTYPVTIVATDNGTPALSGNAAITISVTEVNVAPILAAIGNKTGTVGVAVTFTATATDADVPANTLTFSLDAGAPAGSTINGSTGAFSWTPSAAGTFPVTVRVTDNGTPAMNDFEAISITVSPAPNQPPVLGAIGNKTTAELATLAFTATATDPDAGQTVTFSLDAGAPAGATIGGATGAFSWTPTEAQGPGSFPVTIRATDNGSPALSDFEAISISVTEVNVAPVLGAIGNRTVNELATLAFTATATDADLPANTLTFSLDAGAPTGATINGSTGAFSWTPTEAQGPSSNPITVRVTDNGTPALNDFELITVTVNEVNVAPVVTSPGNRTTAELVNLAFTVTATDADVPANTIAWSLTLGTPAATGATIGAGNGAFSWTPTEAQGPGTYPVTITATDNGTPALSGTAAITISVTEVNVAPVLAAIGNKSGTIGTAITFTATATDADVPANTLTFSLDAGAPAGSTINGSTGAFTWTPSANGTFPVTVRVTDNGTPALNDFEAISITVSPAPNTAPVLGAIGNKTVNELATLTFTATATDADVPAQTLTFSLDAGAPAGATINGSTGAFSWTPTEAQGPASTPITVRVTDNGTGNLSDTETITVTVNEVNVAPVVTSPGNRTTAELANLAFTVTATDADVPANTIAWSLTLGTPAATGAAINPSTGAFSWTPTEAQGPGTYPVTIVATDNGTPALSGNAAITITVTEVNVAPVVTSPGNRTTAELANLAFTVTATDADVPANTIAWSLTLGTPAATGATIGAGTGAFSWTPTEAQGPGTYPVTIVATDNGTPALSGNAAITISVTEVNVAPVVTSPGNRTTAELANLAFTVTATDADVPANTIAWSLTLGTPAATGATIGAGTGAFSWTPTEAQGPGTYPVTIVATDNGTPALSGTAAITISVTEVNVAPVLAAIGNKSGTVGVAVTFTATATDADIPANTLTFSLDAGAPAGATIGGATGAFSWTPSAAGTFPVTVRVTDNGTPAMNDFEAISITVSPGANQPPVLGAIGNKTVNELATLAFTATATDPDAGQTVTFSLDAGAPAGATIGGASGAFSWTPTEAQGPSSNPITVRVTDNGSPALSDFEAITVTVNEVNVAPVLAAIGNKTGTVGVAITFTATATDADIPANTLTFSLDAGAPAGATIGGATGAFSWTPSANGTFPVTVRVTDNGTPAMNDFEVISITVSPAPNQPPVLAAIGNKTVNELATLAFTATATDPDAGQTLTFSLDAGAPAGATIGGASGAFSWTPTEAQGPSSNPITVRVTDNGSPALNDFEAITVTVNEVNVAPVVANPGNKTTAELATLAFTVTATDADVPANTIAWSLTLGTPAATGATIGSGTGAFSWTPTEAQGPGTYPVTITATDNGTPALSGTAAITISVTEVNVAPVLAAIGNKSGTVGVAITFTATATDADIPANTLTFSLDAGAPAGATIGGATGAFSWTPSANGTFPVTVRVTDNGTPAMNDFEVISITVSPAPNQPPVLAAIGNKTVNELATLAFTATATDPDAGQTLTFSLDAGAPAGATIGGASGAFSWTPTEAQGPSSNPITVRVTDNGSPALSDFEAITVTVNEVNVAPVLGAIGNKTVNELATLTFTATATDADIPANTLTFSLDAGAPAGATINGSTGAFSWTPTEAQGPGSYPATVRVTDNGTPAMNDFEAITITVNEVNVAPVLAVITDKTVNQGSLLTFTATATDADIPANTLTFSLDAGAPAGATINGSTGVFNWTPPTAGSFPVTARVTDNGTPALSDAKSFTIIVQGVNHAPTLTQPADMTVTEGGTADQLLVSTDPDAGDVLTHSKVSGPAFMTVDGSIHLAPGSSDAGTYTGTVRVTDNGVPPLSDTKSLQITVLNANSAPTADADGPYSGGVGANISFDGTGSSDPDGDALTFAWDFGDGGTGSGSSPVHAYAAEGTFTVSLRVTDPDMLYDDDTTTATIRAEVQADILLEDGSSTLNAKKTGNRQTIIGLEQQVLPYNDLILSSIRMTHSGPPGFVSECAPDPRYFVIGDLDGDGINDAEIRFANKCLANLFNEVPSGSVQTVAITGEFLSGGSSVPLHATRDLTILVKHRQTPILVIASPNPFNPETAISYTVSNSGAVSVKIYSVDGRLIRTLKQGEETAAGTHEVMWNGTDDGGNHVSSGIYFVKTSQKVGTTEEASVLKVALTK